MKFSVAGVVGIAYLMLAVVVLGVAVELPMVVVVHPLEVDCHLRCLAVLLIGCRGLYYDRLLSRVDLAWFSSESIDWNYYHYTHTFDLDPMGEWN